MSFGKQPNDRIARLRTADSVHPVAVAIREHEHAYAARIAARDRHVELHLAFDPEWSFDNDDVIRDTLRAIHGAEAPVEIDRYFASLSASDKAWEMEEATFNRLEAVELSTAEQLTRWQAYILKFAQVGEDQTAYVTLARVIEKFGCMLAKRLAA